MKVTDETKANAQAVLEYIEKYPDRHDQNYWVNIDGEWKDPSLIDKIQMNTNVCNTKMCVAGTVVFLNEGREGLRDFITDEQAAIARAGDYLGLDDGESFELFYYTEDNKAPLEALRYIAEGKDFSDAIPTYEEYSDDDYY